ncbi:Isoprenylcysteine carboxyl methyltransferase [Thermovirga lienii DSM 17291]|uniref:Isoprenylcysteine carboxyl methyltransferase n=1 Tax=Thermovirga lienii (strain ATCC BAA-1197 / DSM 17291 / Cas60314) TaxID=580340 RepID=G7V5Q4_THELD|nr:isoprenylcysteine carboxylmethyltransferase family protein [Thermovirga lienii]AER66964.1 Isoprenylcysteine carboxyl methyltransferase [Thermovirga lienii DSM 17291]MDN5319076.1 hypothetical protein [Thermovirga sp.]MDN5367538.1 hypothetical protein [Thermovirga sp.]HCD72380.1 isoprenylcysteine carboxylmethyltransferase family protein [Thermovirga lienii]
MRFETNREHIRALAFKYRGGVWTLLFFVVYFLAEPSRGSIYLGLPLVVLGQLIRLWAAGTIKKYRGESVKAEQLITWGPYGLVRNPLYIGNGLIGLGWALISGSLLALVVFLVVFVLLYGMLIVPWEEKYLGNKFPEEYNNYKKQTGRFFPKGMIALDRLRGPFDLRILWISERYSLAITVLGTFILIFKGGVLW